MRTLLGLLCVVLIGGCGGGRDALDQLDQSSVIAQPGRQNGVNEVAKGSWPTALHRPSSAPVISGPPQDDRTIALKGSDRFIAENRSSFRLEKTNRGAPGVTLNLVDVPVAVAAKTVLGDVFGFNFTVAQGLNANLTLQTTTPVAKPALLDAFEDALRLSGAALVENAGFYRVVPASAASRPGRIMMDRRRARKPGVGVYVVAIEHVSAAEMERLIKPMAPGGTVVRIDRPRNLVLVTGTRSEAENTIELIELFDADWMRGLSFAVVPVESSDPDTIVGELRSVFGLDKDGPLKGVVRFIANKRLSAVLVISKRRRQIERARRWIRRFEKLAEKRERRLYVYKIQNRPAGELAGLLQQVLASETGSGATAAGDIAPRFTPERITSPSGARAQGRPDTRGLGSGGLGSGGLQSSQAAGRQPTRTDATGNGPANDSGAAATAPSQPANGQTAIVADVPNNALLIRAYPKDYRKVLRILERLDVLPTQVALEAVIAEISLNNELRYGIKWFFKNKKSSFTFSDTAGGAIASLFPGFSYFFQTANIQLALDALSGVTKVNVVSAPSLVVMDNRTATLQIGDQVPVVTQTSQGTQDANSPIVSAVQLQDTGVILKVTPRVNDSGRVMLDISQEVSSVTRTTTSGIDSPTIQQRRIETTVVVNDGEVIALGGLIHKRNEVGREQVPVLGSIPFIGSAFRQKEDTRDRTELVIFIRPQIMRDGAEARRVTDEFRRRLDLIKPQRSPGRNRHERDVRRATQ